MTVYNIYRYETGTFLSVPLQYIIQGTMSTSLHNNLPQLGNFPRLYFPKIWSDASHGPSGTVLEK